MKKNIIIEFVASIFSGGKGYETEVVKTTPLPKKAILCTLVITALVLALVFSLIEISSLSSDIGDFKKELITLTSKETKLTDDLGHKYPIANLLDEIEAAGFTKDGGNTVTLEEEKPES